MTLVIMAAGLGSRFGGLKQIEPIDNNNNIILDYSVYDAIKNGCNKVVFIIKEENYNIFRDTIGKRIEDKVQVEYVFQNNDNIPSWANIPIDRIKPLGTAHAILCCKDVVKEDFVIINADDFYGEDAFKEAFNYIKSNNESNNYAMVGYQVGNTLTTFGSVKRGVCETDGVFLSKIIESSVEKIDDKVLATPLNGSDKFYTSTDTLVSMNMFICNTNLFEYLEEYFNEFLKNNNLLTDEFLLPEVICDLVFRNIIKVKILKTTSKWHGMTYKEDKELLVYEINKLIENKVYPKNLWQ